MGRELEPQNCESIFIAAGLPHRCKKTKKISETIDSILILIGSPVFI